MTARVYPEGRMLGWRTRLRYRRVFESFGGVGIATVTYYLTLSEDYVKYDSASL
nr:hypothetical protein [Candidatus Njordarchaeota archaeon]